MKYLAFYLVLIVSLSGCSNTESENTSSSENVGPPSSFSISGGIDHVHLDWADSPGAVEYGVYRALTSIPYYEQIAKTTHSSYNDFNFDFGIGYSYYVTTIYSEGSESSNSSILSFVITNTDSPNPPTTLFTTTDSSSITIHWSNPTDEDLLYVDIYKDIASDGAFIEKVNAASIYKSFSTFQDTNIASGVTYYYRMRAIDVAGNTSVLSQHTSAIVYE